MVLVCVCAHGFILLFVLTISNEENLVIRFFFYFLGLFIVLCYAKLK